MNTKLIVGLAALLLLAPAGMAYSYQRESTGPTTVKSSVAGEFGIAGCDDGDIGDHASFIACGTGGIGAIIDVSDISNSTNYVSGTCEVEQTSAPDNSLFGPFSFSCGTDRDNDDIVTNVDESSTTLGAKNNGPPGGPGTWDDDFDGADVDAGAQGSVGICFRADVDSTKTNSNDPYPSSAVWDDFTVFIAINADSTDVSAGTYAVNIDVIAASNGGCLPSSQIAFTW
jgi:hypothetical protein